MYCLLDKGVLEDPCLETEADSSGKQRTYSKLEQSSQVSNQSGVSTLTQQQSSCLVFSQA